MFETVLRSATQFGFDLIIWWWVNQRGSSTVHTKCNRNLEPRPNYVPRGVESETVSETYELFAKLIVRVVVGKNYLLSGLPGHVWAPLSVNNANDV